MLPEEYQIDEGTARRMEEEAGAALPEGAVEALYEFEKEHPEFAEAVRRRLTSGAESVWLLAIQFAHLGPLKYVEYWRDEIARQARTLQEMLGIPPVTEYVIDGFRIKNLGPQPVEVDGDWFIQDCWRLTDDGAEQHTMDVYLGEDDDVEKVLRTFTRWTRQIQGEDEAPPS